MYGDGDADLTKYGTRQGISATTLLVFVLELPLCLETRWIDKRRTGEDGRRTVQIGTGRGYGRQEWPVRA